MFFFLFFQNEASDYCRFQFFKQKSGGKEYEIMSETEPIWIQGINDQVYFLDLKNHSVTGALTARPYEYFGWTCEGTSPIAYNSSFSSKSNPYLFRGRTFFWGKFSPQI